MGLGKIDLVYTIYLKWLAFFYPETAVTGNDVLPLRGPPALLLVMSLPKRQLAPCLHCTSK